MLEFSSLMSSYLEGAGRHYEEKGHPEVGRGFKVLAQLGKKLGIPEEFKSAEEVEAERLLVKTPVVQQRKVSWYATDQREHNETLLEEMLEAEISPRTANAIVRSLRGTSDNPNPELGIKRAEHLSYVTDEELQERFREFGPKSIKEIRRKFPYSPSPEGILPKNYPEIEDLPNVADVYTLRGYPEVGEIINVFSILGKQTEKPENFGEEPKGE